MINNKAVALATLNWLGTKVNENKIQDILFPPEIDSVWLKSIFGRGKETPKLPKQVKELNLLDEAFVMLLEDENVLCFSTLTMTTDVSQLSDDIFDSNQALNRKKTYEESVVRNKYIASKQGKSCINYASNQREMMNVTKEYAALIQLCTKLIKRECGDVDDNA